MYGAETDQSKQTHKLMVPFHQLPADIQQNNIDSSSDTIKVVLALGYQFIPDEHTPSSIEDIDVPDYLDSVVEILVI